MDAKRRIAVGAVTAAVSLSGLAACGGDDSSSASGGGGTTEVQVMMFPGVAYRLPVLVADEKGYFQDEGVSINEIAQPNNLPGVQAMNSTKSDVGQFAVATAAQAGEAGEDVKLFCGHVAEVQSSIVANADTDLPSTEDGATWQEVMQALEGEKFGVQVPVGAGFQLLTAAAFAEAGVEDLTYVNVGGSNTTTGPALDNGDVAAAIASPPGTQFLTESGKQKVLAYLPDGPTAYADWYGSAWGAPTSFLEEDPEAAEGFCRAVQKGIDYVKDPANADEMVQLLMEDTGVPQNIAELVVADQFEPYSTALPQDILETTLKGYAGTGILKSDKVTYDTLVDDKSGQ